MNLHNNFLKVLPAFAKIPVHIVLHQEDQLHKLILQINPLLQKIITDNEIFWDILELSPKEAKLGLDKLSPINLLFEAFHQSLKQIDTNDIQTEKVKKDFNTFLIYALSFFDKMQDMTEVLKSIAENRPVDEDSESYKKFALEYAEMIENAQPMQKGSSRSLRESLGI